MCGGTGPTTVICELLSMIGTACYYCTSLVLLTISVCLAHMG